MARSNTSKRWLDEHFNDPYVKKAQKEGYRSRAVYKLKEIDDKVNLIQPGMTIVDLGAAPGGWSQYVTKKLRGNGQVIALDILPMEPLPFVHFLQGDFTETSVLETLEASVKKGQVDLVLSDMAPNMSGSAVVDMPRAMYLCELALAFSDTMLKPGGGLFMKLFHGSGFEEIVKTARGAFLKVSVKKPEASRSRSRETYLLAQGYNL